MNDHTDDKKIIKEMMRLAFSAGTAHGLATALQSRTDTKAGKTLKEMEATMFAAEEEALKELFTHFKF